MSSISFRRPEFRLHLGYPDIILTAGNRTLGRVATAALLLSILFTLNLLLMIFNLIPFPPLDGAGAIGLFFSEEGARRVQGLLHRPQLSLLGLLLAWIAMRRIFGPIHRLAVNLLYPGQGYG